MTSVVVGGGPAGAVAAKTLSRTGDVVVFEEHSRQPVQCAGLISVSGLERLGISPKDSLLNTVRGARFYSPSGRCSELRADKPKAYVVDRRRFDELLLEEASFAGARIRRERVVGVVPGRVRAKSIAIDAERIVLATGVDYRMHRTLGLDHPKRFLVGAQADVKVECDPDFVELHLNVPGFFSWVIPAGDFARVGLCARTNPTPYLASFLKHLKACGRMKRVEPRNRVYGIIPVYDPKVRADYGWVRCVGDAAGQVKATTGGGVVLGAVAASLVGERDYERAWRRAIGRELSLHLMLRRMVDRISARNVDVIFDILDASAGALEGGGDMDYASKTIRSLLGSPKAAASLLVRAPKILRSLL